MDVHIINGKVTSLMNHLESHGFTVDEYCLEKLMEISKDLNRADKVLKILEENT